MPRYSVPLTTSANSAIIVEVPDDVTDPQEIAARALAKFSEEEPDLCHQCSGGRNGRPELQIGDEWAPSLYKGEPDITRLAD